MIYGVIWILKVVLPSCQKLKQIIYEEEQGGGGRGGGGEEQKFENSLLGTGFCILFFCFFYSILCTLHIIHIILYQLNFFPDHLRFPVPL